MDSQTDRLLALLQRGVRVTPQSALQLIGTMRLGARVYELRNAGYPVQCQMTEVRCADGHTARVAAYFLPTEREQMDLWADVEGERQRREGTVAANHREREWERRHV